MLTILPFIYLLSLVVWIGSIVFFSFYAAPAIFKTLERQTAGKVVGVIFPQYYFLGYVCGSAALVTVLLNEPIRGNLKVYLLLVMLFCSLVAGLVIGPKARAVKAKIHEASEEEREAMEKRFKSLHTNSVRLNGVVLVAGLVLLWKTAGSLVF